MTSPSAFPSKRLKLTKCQNVAHARCGTLPVPLDRTDPSTGTIGIAVEFHPRRDRTQPSLGTLVAVQGGPGYSTRASRGSYLELFRPLMRRRDVLFVDNRGTGASEAIDCPKLQSYRGDYVRNAGACGRSLGTTAVDYGTADAADDLASVLDALGIDKIDLYGDSYGTFFGQTFAVRHGDRLRTLTLDSTYPVDGADPWYSDTNRAIEDAFRLACSRDQGCSAVGGDTMSRVADLADALHAHPFSGSALDADGHLRHFTVDTGTLITLLAAAASSFDVYRELDPAIRAYLGPEHDRVPLLRLAAENLYFSGAGDYRGFSEGLYLATNCNDIPLAFDRTDPVAKRRKEYAASVRDLKQNDPHAFAPFTVNEWLHAPLSGVQPYDSCLLWPPPSRPDPPLPADPVYPTVPTLVFSGDLDSLTSPEGAHQVATHFPNVTFVDVHNMNHIAALGDYGRCASAIVVRFIQTRSPGDTNCASAYNEVRMVDSFPTNASDLGPMPAARRAALVASDTAADVFARWNVMVGYHGVGLRGGTFSTKGLVHVTWRLHDVRWVNDAAVDGTMTWDRTDGAFTADLAISGPGVEPAHLHLQWNDWDTHAVATVRGTVVHRHVHLSFPAS